MTEGLRLRPVVDGDLTDIERMVTDAEAIGEFNWGGFRDTSRWRKWWEENRLLADEKSVLMVDLAGTSLGFVSWSKVRTGGLSHCFDIGISLWPKDRGKGHGTAAQRLLARYLFAHSQMNRIQAFTDRDNVAEQRSLEKAGFTREAVLCGYTYRDGAWRDEVLYRMLRSELPVDDEPDGEATEDRG